MNRNRNQRVVLCDPFGRKRVVQEGNTPEYTKRHKTRRAKKS